jgi:hypothetical protein
MIKFNISCFHDAERFEGQKAVKMVPTYLPEFNTITAKCPECGNEIIIKWVLEGSWDN